jgi:hypothetical protein
MPTMDAWGTLLATVVGAAIALLGQHLIKRAEDRARSTEMLLEQCAAVAASSADFRDRIWEERHLGLEGRVAGWDLSALRLATARLQILSKDEALLSSLDQLNRAGRRLGSRWRRSDVNDADYSDLWDQHHAAVKQFIAMSGKAVHRRLSRS